MPKVYKRGWHQAFGDAAIGAAAAGAFRAVRGARDYIRNRQRNHRNSMSGQHKGYLKTLNFKKRPGGYDKYDKLGYKHQQETSGLVSSLHAAYIGNNAINTVRYYETIIGAVVRFLMRRHFGVQYGATSDYIYPFRAGGAWAIGDPYTLELAYSTINSTTGVVSPGLLTEPFNDTGTANFRTFESVVTNLAMKINNIASFGNNNTARIESVNIQVVTAAAPMNVATSSTIRHILPAKDLYLKVYGIQHLTLQNATVSEGGSSNTDVVDSNPIVGKQYYYRGSGGPNLNQRAELSNWGVDWPGFYQRMDQGIWFPSTDPVGVFQNVPGPEAFRGITSYKTIYLQPGQSSKYVIKKTLKGNLSYLLTALYHDADLVNNYNWQYWSKPDKNIGQFFCFEKALKADRRVRLYYHLDMYHGAIVTGTSVGSMRGPFGAFSVNAATNPVQAPQGLAEGAGADVPITTLTRSFAVADLPALSEEDPPTVGENLTTVGENPITDSTVEPVVRPTKRRRRRLDVITIDEGQELPEALPRS